MKPDYQTYLAAMTTAEAYASSGQGPRRAEELQQACRPLTDAEMAYCLVCLGAVELQDGRHVRLPAWAAPKVATVGIAQDIAQSLARGHVAAFAVYTGATLTNSRDFYIQSHVHYQEAVVLGVDRLVLLGRRLWRVRVTRGCEQAPRYSDPIRLDLVPADRLHQRQEGIAL